MASCRVVIFGYDQLVLSSLDVVAASDAEVVGVVFPSTRTESRVARVRAEVEARGHSVLLQPLRAEVEPFVAQLRALEPDVGLIWSYPMILPESVFSTPLRGCVNLHPALLPQYRGTCVLQWMLIDGAREGGVTLHEVDKGIDTGPVIAQASYDIGPADDLRSLMQRSKLEGEQLLEQWWPAVADGSAVARPQDASLASYRRALTTADREIDWSKPNKEIADLVRGLGAPDEGAWSTLHGQRVVVRACTVAAEGSRAGGKPGTVTAMDASGLRVATGSGGLLVLNIEVPEASRLPDGFDISLGDRLGA